MTFKELHDLIKNLDVYRGNKYTISGNGFSFGLKADVIFDNDVVIFGGYGNHTSIWDLEYTHPEEIVEGIIEHMLQYEDTKLEDCDIKRK